MEIELHADTGRGRPLADPHGREFVLGCGAALFNMRLAMLHLGFRPVVHTFPDPRDPAHLATVGWGAYSRPTDEEQRLYAARGRRHTAHGPSLPEPLPPDLVDEMRETHASRRREHLHVIADVVQRRLLAELVRVGEEARRIDAWLAAEQAA
ncbi:hypothetical protein [Streptomyces sp. enrichment culture]|uniref:hypothetical protein n=1 Tax=Streptomyces sp. enrichment culture TaxID=1795815 RepID=UPI003F57ED39